MAREHPGESDLSHVANISSTLSVINTIRLLLVFLYYMILRARNCVQSLIITRASAKDCFICVIFLVLIMEIKKNVLGLIGNTPMMYLDRFRDNCKARIAAKLEMFNPSSVKDRPVLYMIQEAEKRGDIRPGHSTII